MTDMPAPEMNGNRVTLRDVYTAVGEVEARIVDRIDRLERGMERRSDEHASRIDGLSGRVEVLERRSMIEDTRTRDIRSILGDSRTLTLYIVAIAAFVLSLLDFR